MEIWDFTREEYLKFREGCGIEDSEKEKAEFLSHTDDWYLDGREKEK